MRSRIMKVLFLALPVMFISSHSFAFDPAVDCNLEITVTLSDIEESGLGNILANPYLINNEYYAICFQLSEGEEIELNASLLVGNKDKPFNISGLRLKKGWTSGGPFDPPKPFTGTFISINGSNIALYNYYIENATTAIEVAGSNVEIVDSQISVTQMGILVGDVEKERINNITIKNSTISGPGALAGCSTESLDHCVTKGISIENADMVTITDNPDTIENFDIGVDGKAAVVGVKFKNVSVPIKNDDYVVDETMVGKRLYDNGEYVYEILDENKQYDVEIVGLAPKCNGTVDMYISDKISDDKEELSPYKSCDVGVADADICLMPPEKDIPENYVVNECDKDSIRILAKECIFKCGLIGIKASNTVKFVYTSENGITNGFSDKKVIGKLKHYATFAPATPLPAGDELIDEAESDDDGSDKTSASGGASNVEMPGDTAPDAPLGDGMGGGISPLKMAMGCSLTTHVPLASEILFLFVVLIVAPIAVRIRRGK